jgi:hypothetical protein
LKARAVSIEVDPRRRQRRFSLKLSSTVWRDFPPYLTMVSWMMMVATTITRKSLLLKKCSKTLYSLFFNLRALISLKTCNKTKTLKKME